MYGLEIYNANNTITGKISLLKNGSTINAFKLSKAI